MLAIATTGPALAQHTLPADPGPAPLRDLVCEWQARCLDDACTPHKGTFAIEIQTGKLDGLVADVALGDFSFDWNGQRRTEMGEVFKDGGFIVHSSDPSSIERFPEGPLSLYHLAGQLRLIEFSRGQTFMTSYVSTCARPSS